MANADSKSSCRSHQVLRSGRVGYIPDPKRFHHPQIRIKGKWLAEAGFTIETLIDIRVMEGCLVITKQEPVPELNTMLKPVEKLSERSQKELEELIHGLLLRDKIIR